VGWQLSSLNPPSGDAREGRCDQGVGVGGEQIEQLSLPGVERGPQPKVEYSLGRLDAEPPTSHRDPRTPRPQCGQHLHSGHSSITS
jgi:hypothetical protein